MIVSDKFLIGIAPLVKSTYFESTYARVVSIWVIEYYQRYKESPKKNIKEIYKRKKKGMRNEEETGIVAEFLASLSDDWNGKEIQNIQYALNSAIHYLKLKSLQRLKEKIDDAINDSNPVIGEQSVAKYYRVEAKSGEGISIFKNPTEITEAFLTENEVLFSFPGALGRICGNFLRGDLVAFLGAPNRGKTWWLLYTAIRASLLGLKSVFFTLEMPKHQIIRRAWTSLLGQPRERMKISMPFFEKENDKFLFKEKKITKDKMNVSDVKTKQKNFKSQLRAGDLKIVPVPAYSTTVDEFEAHLDNMEHYDNYIPDVVVIDYADIVSPPKEIRGDYRHQIDGIWKKLRGLAQERNILVVSASQADRGSLKKDANEWNIAEDIRKLAHVSKLMVLNQSKEEYEKNIMRIRQLKERDGRKDTRQAVVLQCLDIGRPYLDSKFDYEVVY